MKMLLVPIVFGETGVAMFNMWFSRVSKVMTREIHSYPHPLPVPPLRSLPINGPLHMKGVLAIAAYRCFNRPIVVCDTDWFPKRDLPFEDYLDSPLSMAEDAGHRRQAFLDGEEKNSGLLVITRDLLDDYCEIWTDPGFQIQYGHIPWADQIATTILWEKVGGAELPESWNRSHWHPGPFPDSKHYHGPSGKDRMKRELGI